MEGQTEHRAESMKIVRHRPWNPGSELSIVQSEIQHLTLQNAAKRQTTNKHRRNKIHTLAIRHTDSAVCQRISLAK